MTLKTPFLSHLVDMMIDMPTLTETDREILAIASQWWQHAGAKESAIREKFGMSATRYYMTLNALLDRDDALAFDPLLVKRLRRLRAGRQLSRPRSRQA